MFTQTRVLQCDSGPKEFVGGDGCLPGPYLPKNTDGSLRAYSNLLSTVLNLLSCPRDHSASLKSLTPPPQRNCYRLHHFISMLKTFNDNLEKQAMGNWREYSHTYDSQQRAHPLSNQEETRDHGELCGNNSLSLPPGFEYSLQLCIPRGLGTKIKPEIM